MATYDFTFGNLAGLQEQGGAQVGVNFFELDFAEVAKTITLAAGDIVTIGLLPKGALLRAATAETIGASQSGASALTLQDDTATPVVILSGHDITTLGAFTGPSAGTALFFGGGSSAGLHNVLLTAQKKLNVLIGATPPTKGKLRAAVDMSLMGGF